MSAITHTPQAKKKQKPGMVGKALMTAALLAAAYTLKSRLNNKDNKKQKGPGDKTALKAGMANGMSKNFKKKVEMSNMLNMYSLAKN